MFVRMFQVVYADGDNSSAGSLMKLKVPVAEVLSYSLFSASATPSYSVIDNG